MKYEGLSRSPLHQRNPKLTRSIVQCTKVCRSELTANDILHSCARMSRTHVSSYEQTGVMQRCVGMRVRTLNSNRLAGNDDKQCLYIVVSYNAAHCQQLNCTLHHYKVPDFKSTLNTLKWKE
ncbi:hypothetical protein EVAR_82374_1 [Eumeta japonica]|uniref:Uncharacterized protein n=1 Tax=Eumeta variegata TaxID=151549 RepID=A0A4C1UA67_EUMVA|nr:hypothetical protein EVAR_82374_1 [Eumeta japonica]